MSTPQELRTEVLNKQIDILDVMVNTAMQEAVAAHKQGDVLLVVKYIDLYKALTNIILSIIHIQEFDVWKDNKDKDQSTPSVNKV